MILHCFSAPDRLEECVERGYLCSFAGNVTYPKATDLQDAAARACPPSCCWSRPTRRTCRRSRVRGKPQRARQRRPHRAAAWPSCAGSPTRSSSAPSSERRARLRLVSGEPRQASLRRLRRVRDPAEPRARPELPDRRQHPRRDRRAPPSSTPADVVLEVGGGLGVLSEYLAPRVGAPARGRGRPLARAAAARRARRRSTTPTSTWPTPSSSTSASLDPAPAKVVANLPYGVAATVLLKSIDELPGRDALGGDGPARGGRAARGGARREGVRRDLGARPARLRGARAAPGAARPSSTRSRTSTRRSCCCAAARPRRRPELIALVHAALRPPPQGAGRLARARARRARRHPRPPRAPRSSRSAIPPTPAPSASPPADWPRLADAIGRERSRPAAVTALACPR